MKGMRSVHQEGHLIDRVGWLRAAVLGANDGLVSTASLIVGVAASAAGTNEILVAGSAGLAAGAMSMAAGEYVSVSSQSDTELADLAKERQELIDDPVAERDELARIYVERGLDYTLALQVADQLMARDALGAHAKDELGISEFTQAKPVQAALTSAVTFSIGASVPLTVAALSPSAVSAYTVAAASLVFLAILGAVGAKAGGADIARGTARVAFWGAAAMGITAGIGHLVGHAV